MLKTFLKGAVALTLCTLVCSSTRAQPFTPTIAPSTSPIVVSQQQEKIALRPKVQEQTLINIAFGATINGGNTRTFAGNLGGRFGQIHDNHQVMLEALGTLAGARSGSLSKPDWTARNVIARARYDLFLSRDNALFVAMAPRRDRFAGIDLRLQNQIGYLRNLYRPAENHRFWSELGYDFTYDNFAAVDKTVSSDITSRVRDVETQVPVRPDPPLVPEGATITQAVKTRGREGHNFVHSARIFFGYTNRLFTSASLSLGAETLLDFQDKRNVRVNGLAELTSSITQSFKLGVQSRLLFDNVTVPNADKLDTIVAVQLVYTFDSAALTQVTVCPACDCTSQVQAARAACRSTEPLRQITP